MVKLNKEEKEIPRYQKIAAWTFKKDKNINLRISKKNLDGLRERALEEGIPYQTLVSSILHKFVNGRLAKK